MTLTIDPPQTADTTAPQYERLAMARIRLGRNCRKTFDPVADAGLATSMNEVGLLEPIIVRPVDPVPHFLIMDPENEDEDKYTIVYEDAEWGFVAVEGVTGRDSAQARADELSAATYRVVAGARRFNAARFNGWGQIECIVREMSDQTEAAIQLIENVTREELSPLDEAEGYLALREIGFTPAEICAKTGKLAPYVSSRTAVAKSLPSAAKAMIRDGRLSMGHGITLLRFKDHPEVLIKIAELTIERKASVRDIEKGIPFLGTLQQAGMLEYLSPNNIEIFGCRECPFSAMHETTTGSFACLYPPHFNEMQAVEAKKALLANEEAIERVRSAARAQEVGAQQEERKKPEETWGYINGDTTPDPTVGSQAPAPDAVAPSLPKLSDLKRDQYEECRTDPEGCSSECPCRGMAIGYSGSTTQICLNPKRFKNLQQTETKRLNVARRERVTAILKTATKLTRPDNAPASVHGKRALILLASQILHMKPQAVRRDALQRFGVSPEVIGVLLSTGLRGDQKETWDALDTMPFDDVLAFAIEVMFRDDCRKALDASSDGLPEIRWFIRPADAAEPADDQQETEPAEDGAQAEASQALPATTERERFFVDTETLAKIGSCYCADKIANSGNKPWPSLPAYTDSGDCLWCVVGGSFCSEQRAYAMVDADEGATALTYLDLSKRVNDEIRASGQFYSGFGAVHGGKRYILQGPEVHFVCEPPVSDESDDDIDWMIDRIERTAE